MLRQFLLVGLGGSGGKTLRYTKQVLEEWLIGVGWDEGMPDGWQFLHIDTPDQQDSPVLPGKPELLPSDEYFSIYQRGIDFQTIAKGLLAQGTNFDGWWVDPVRMRVPIQSGAGQYRSVGRVIALDQLPNISDRLGRQISRMNQATASAQLHRLESLAIGDSVRGDTSPMLFIISSLAGGTGAGLVTDVADVLRSLGDAWLDNSFAILYAADVFQYLSKNVTAGIQPNAAAAIAELSHGNFGGGGFAAPGRARLANLSGPKYPFLVGHQNANGVVFGDQIDVYRVIGRGLSAIMTEPSLQDYLASYTYANWQNNAKKFPATGSSETMLLDSHYHGVFQGFGYSELELGVERFAMYAARRIARDAIEWVLDAHERIAENQQRFEDATPDQIIETLADDALARFLGKTLLDERGPDANDIIDGINPEEDGRRIYQSTLNDVVSGVESINWNRERTDKWADLIIQEAELRYGSAIAEYDHLLRTAASEWSDRMFIQVQEAVELQISHQGLAVAEQVINRAMEELEKAARELEGERHEWAVQAGHLRSNVNAVLDHLGGGQLHKDAPEIREACDIAVRTSVFYRMEEKRRFVGAALIDDLIPNVLGPLSRSLRDARQTLKIEIDPRFAMSQPVDYWPRHEPASDRVTPEQLRPGGSVASVIDPDDFPDLFDALIEAAIGDRAETQDHMYRLAREDVIRGRFMKEQRSVVEAHQHLSPAITPVDVWIPDDKLLIGGRPRQPGRFALEVSRNAILNRASAWVYRDGYSFERFVEQGLREYLSESPGVSAQGLHDRREAFMAALEKAFKASAPLVHIDNAAVATIHAGDATKLSPSPSEIPLGDHPLEDRVRDYLHTVMAGGNKGTYTQSPRVTKISVFSTLDGALHPAAFSSITAPIADAWRDAIRTDNLENFWQWRRARPLSEAVPIPRDTLRALVRGWLTANALAMLDVADDGTTVSIMIDGKTVTSPQLIQTPGANMYEVLGVLVETLAVALPTAAHSKQFDKYLGIYDELIQLGTAASPGRSPGEYPTVNRVITRWVDTGGAWDGKPDDIPGAEDPDSRADHLANLYRTAISQYIGLADEARTKGQITSSFAWLGLVPVIEIALQDLVDAIERMHSPVVGV